MSAMAAAVAPASGLVVGRSGLVTTPARSALMSRIRGDDLGPESRFKGALSVAGLTFLANPGGGLGRPDVCVPASRLAVFVDGCFWHGCPAHRRPPASNAAFWAAKEAANRARDARQSRALKRDGWCVVRLWEHELAKGGLEACVRRVVAATRLRAGW